MTPRSRKPVIIGALRDMTRSNYHKKIIGFQDDEAPEDDPDFDEEEIPDQMNTTLHRSKSEGDLWPRSPVKNVAKSTSDETLSTPFR